MRRPALLAAALAFLALFFGWETWRAWNAPLPAADNGARAPGASWQPGVAVEKRSPPPEVASMIAAVTARPLFRADRQPFGAGGGSSRAYEQELSGFSLIGILVIGDEQKGLVVSKAGNRSERWEVKAGDSLPGFKVKAVLTDGLALTADGKEFTLPLYAGAPKSTGGALRTEVPRRDAAPGTPAAAPSPGAPPPRPGGAPPLPGQVGGLPRPDPGRAPAVLGTVQPPPAVPRYIPGRR
jgi:hypothetical protein